MSEVVKLQLIGLSVIGVGIVILLFVRAQFARVMGFVAIVLGLFSLVALAVPQMASLPPAEEKFDIATVKTPTDMAAIGQKIFFSKGQCALCHSIGPSESARCPDLKGIGAKLSREFIFESLTQPQAYIYLDYRHEGAPKEYPARMPYINKNPIGLTKNEILSVIAFLQQMSGEPISVTPSDLEVPGQAPPAPLKTTEAAPLPSHKHAEEAPMGSLTKPVILLVVTYLLLKFVVPNIPGSAPLPSSLIFLYLMLTIAGIVIFETMSGESKDAFWGPIQRFLTGENIGALQTARYAVLIVFPLLVGWQTYGSTAVSDEPPAENRTIHPAPPGEYTGLSNPVAKTPDNIMQGKGFYAAFCSPCHGGNFDGKGPAARGFNPPPANFSDPTTIAMLQESYLFWRIKKGGVGLPIEGMPWKSAMPRWEVELPDEWIWKIILGEYDGAHQSPRTWE